MWKFETILMWWMSIHEILWNFKDEIKFMSNKYYFYFYFIHEVDFIHNFIFCIKSHINSMDVQ